MCSWSKYPDGNVESVDTFACMINQYFRWQHAEDPVYLGYAESENDPGVATRISLLRGWSPVFDEEDLRPENLDAMLQITRSYADHYKPEAVIGFAMSWARVLNNEPFGLKEGAVPSGNLLGAEFNEYVSKELGLDQLDLTELEEFFGGATAR